MNDIKNIAITFQNLVQFYSMKHGIDALISKGYPVDIYVPINNDDSGVGDMFTETYDKLINMGYSPIRELDPSKHYKILLEPYPMDIYYKFNFKYRIKYKYSLLSAKPDLVYNPENNLYYDAILLFSPYEASYLRAYSNIEIIGNLKYINLQRLDKPSTHKHILLYLPTYGDSSSIDTVLDELKKIKQDYYLIVKFHHGTSFLRNELNRIEQLKSISDEYYDHNIELAQLLSKVDVVLSDNSGSIFESLYAKVPVAIYSEDINKNKIGNVDTTQFKLVKEGIIPYTDDSKQIPDILKHALSKEFINKQLEIRNKLFYFTDNPIKEFTDIIEKYLNDSIDINYKNIHDVLLNNYNNYILGYQNQFTMQSIIQSKDEEINALKEYVQECNIANEEMNVLKKQIQECDLANEEINALKKQIQECDLANKELQKNLDHKNLIISYYEKGKLYKLSKKIYQFYFKFKK